MEAEVITLLAYLGIAAYVLVSVAGHGAVRRSERLFTRQERVVVFLTCVLVAALWPLFLPGMGIAATRWIGRALDGSHRGWFAHARATRARG